jgi:type IV pilus assembly protein PilB
MANTRVRLGELLVAAQIITRDQLEEALELQKRDGRRLGKLLVQAGLVTETQVTQILSQQLSLPWVSLYHIDFSRQLLDLVPLELAEKYGLVPIFVRRVRGLGETLYVAMDDPSDEVAQREVSQWCGLPVRAMIAPPSDIRSAIRVYYGGRSTTPSLSDAVAELEAEEALRNRQAPKVPSLSAEAAAPEDEVIPSEPRLPDLGPGPDDLISEPPPDSGPRIEAREVSMPAPARRKSRMVTLTLLDGTQINLPARKPPKPEEKVTSASAPPDLTARDLIAALRAVSHGADASEILGDAVHWQALFAALLSVMLKKQLIADWEFVEEYRKV